jgi:hypothetical protein
MFKPQATTQTQTQVQVGSCTIKEFDESLTGAPKIWYEDNIQTVIKVAPNDTVAGVASALQTAIQKKSDEKSGMRANSTATVLGFSFKGTDISLTSDGQQPISSRLAVGDDFQIKVQYDIQIGQGGASGKATTASAQQQQPNPDIMATSTAGAIQTGGGSCCVIL